MHRDVRVNTTRINKTGDGENIANNCARNGLRDAHAAHRT